MQYEILTLTEQHPRWTELVGAMLADIPLVAEMWADAEHEPGDFAGVTLSVVLADDQPTRWGSSAVAWAGSIETVVNDVPTLKCLLNYERRGLGRDYELYQQAYWHRHHTVVAPSRLPQVTYLFAQAIPLHQEDGWYPTDLTGTSAWGHHWTELRREPPRPTTGTGARIGARFDS